MEEALAGHVARIHDAQSRPCLCEACGKAFLKVAQLKAHERTHTGERPYVCAVCGKAFAQRSTLTSHTATHSATRAFVCEECGKSFVRAVGLATHRRTHTGGWRLECEFCGKGFSNAALLRTHERMHTDERPFECDMCGNGFKTKGALKEHGLTHTGERGHACAQCGRRFSQRSAMKRHLRTHSAERPYACAECGISFRQSRSLAVHLRTHTGERPYSCDECGKRFRASKTLSKHRRVHARGVAGLEVTEDVSKKHRCRFCHESFTRAASLKKHILKHGETKGEEKEIWILQESRVREEGRAAVVSSVPTLLQESAASLGQQMWVIVENSDGHDEVVAVAEGCKAYAMFTEIEAEVPGGGSGENAPDIGGTLSYEQVEESQESLAEEENPIVEGVCMVSIEVHCLQNDLQESHVEKAFEVNVEASMMSEETEDAQTGAALLTDVHVEEAALEFIHMDVSNEDHFPMENLTADETCLISEEIDNSHVQLTVERRLEAEDVSCKEMDNLREDKAVTKYPDA